VRFRSRDARVHQLGGAENAGGGATHDREPGRYPSGRPEIVTTEYIFPTAERAGISGFPPRSRCDLLGP
jgi:hypothetical protein